MECQMFQPITTVYEKSKIDDDDRSTVTDENRSEKSMDEDKSEKSTDEEKSEKSIDDEKSTITDDDKSVVGIGKKRKAEEESESDYTSDEEESDSESESGEEVDWYSEEEADENILIEGRRISNEELVSWMEFQDDPDYDYRKTNKFLNQLRRFLDSISRSGGFEAEHCPGNTWGITTMRPRKEVIQKRHRYPEGYKYLMFLADKAIQIYNADNKTDYEVDHVFNTNTTRSKGRTYYITFTASSGKNISDDKHTFQAKVWDDTIDNIITVRSCQLKPGGVTYQSMDLQAGMDEWLQPAEDISVAGSKSHLSDEQLWELIEKGNPARCVKNKDKFLRKVRSYLESIEKSEGFECTDFPGDIPGLTSIKPRQDIFRMREDIPEGHSYIYLLAYDALKAYNKAEGAQFDSICDVYSTNSLLRMGYGTYYITFTGCDSGNHLNFIKCTFEAKVSDEMSGRNVDFCRRKTGI